MSTLARRLEAEAARLNDRVLAEMYGTNPFWEARFGERGRRMAQHDGNHHLRYLVQSLDADDPTILTKYARWLQSVLVNRGMCSRHLAENFERLARAIADDVPDSAPATELLRAACDALFYESPHVRQLQRLVDRFADDAAQALPDVRRDDVAYFVTYLADAIAMRRPELFIGYVEWFTGFSGRGAMVQSTLRWLHQRLARAAELSPPLRKIARRTVKMALSRRSPTTTQGEST